MAVSAGTATNQAPGLILADVLPAAGATPVALTRAGLLAAPPASTSAALVQGGTGKWDGTAGAFVGLAAGTYHGVNMLSGTTSDWARWQINGVDSFRVEALGRTTAQGVHVGDVGLGAATPGLSSYTGTLDASHFALAQSQDATQTYLNCAGGAIHIQANNTDWAIWQSGKLGIGTAPVDAVHVSLGNAALRLNDANVSSAPLLLRAQAGTGLLSLNQSFYNTAGTAGSVLYSNAPAPYLYFSTTSGDSFITLGTSQTNNVAANERLRIDATGKVGIGTAAPKTTLHSTGSTILGAPSAAVADANIGTSQINLYLDESGHNLKVRVRYSDGSTLKTATIPLV